MINQNSLRVGNVLEFEGRYVEVKTIDPAHVYTVIENGEQHKTCTIGINDDKIFGGIGRRWASKFNPIPLTPELLVKLGATETETPVRNIYSLALPIQDCDVMTYISCWEGFTGIGQHAVNINDWNGVVLPLSIQYLHDLQNLYYCLSGGVELDVTNLLKSEQ
jgi:hypothetical protein